jgi:FAD/FMN-containing dehydrogenase
MTTSAHRERVEQIARQVRERAAHGGKASLEKAAVSHFVPNPHDPRHRDRKIDVRSLCEVLELDPESRRCVAEPGVTFSDLVKLTLEHGLIPKLVPELKTITIGGAVAGCSVEAMSYKYGGFHDSCNWYEIVTGTGEIVRCSPQNEPLLFEMIHGSYGTLGILTAMEFELIAAKPFVKMEYRQFDTFKAFHTEMMERCHANDFDFIDGIVHGREHFVLCLGRMVDHAPYTNDYTGEQIFYKSTRNRREDYLRTYDYLFRYDTECHWLTRTLPGMEHPWVRKLVGKQLLGSTNLLSWSKRLRPVLKHIRHPDVVVDVFIPEPRWAEFHDWYERWIDFYPLWIVPYKAPRSYPWINDTHAKKNPGNFFIDCAVYGKRNNVPGVNYYQLLEDKTRELGGIKTLISYNYYSPETFWSIYHRDHYEQIKHRTDPTNMFRGLYEKFHFGPQASVPTVVPKRETEETQQQSPTAPSP